MELLNALISQEWIVSAVLCAAYILERKERMTDKEFFRVQREEFVSRLDALSNALIAIKERINP